MRTSRILLFVLLVSLVGAACAPAVPAQPTAGEAPVSTVTTLRVLDQFTDDTMSAGIDKLHAMFMEKNPDIVIDRENMTSDDIRTIVQTTLAADTAPDVIYYDTGAGFAGVLARAGLLSPIDALYEQHGWNQRIFEWTRERTRFDGKVYGIGHELEFLGAYYNINLFEELGITVPETYEDLLTVCDVATENGYYAIAFGDQAKWPAYHAFSLAANNTLGRQALDEILFGEGSWDSPEVVRAIDIYFREMNERGCFSPDPVAVSYDDANSLFYTGRALMNFTGTWLIGRVLENVQDFEVGWLFFPSIDGKPVLPPAGLGSGYFVSANSQNLEAAGRYLDFMFSDEAVKVWIEDINVIPPVDVNPDDFDIPDLLKFAVDALGDQEMGHNIDVLTPDNFNTVMADGFQAVLIGEKTPEEQAADLQAAWEQAKSEGKILE